MARHLEAIARLWDAVGEFGPGFVLDTCHAHASGIDLATAVEQIKAITGRIDLVHCNNSRDEAGSGRDRHAPLADGEIATQALIDIVRTAGAPVILETPGGPEERSQEIKTAAGRYRVDQRNRSSRHRGGRCRDDLVGGPATGRGGRRAGSGQSSISKVRRTGWFADHHPVRVEGRLDGHQPAPGHRVVADARVDGVLDEVQVLAARAERRQGRDESIGVLLRRLRPSRGSRRCRRRAPGTARRACGSAPASGCGRLSAPPNCRSSLSNSEEVEPGPARSTNVRMAASGIPLEHHRVRDRRRGTLRVHVQPRHRRHRHPTERVELGAEIAQSGEDLDAALVGGQHRPVDDDELPAAERFRNVGQRWQVQHPERRGHLVRSVGGPLHPAAQHPLGLGAIPDQHPARSRVEGEDLELQRW